MVATDGDSVTEINRGQVKIRILGTADLNDRVRAGVFVSKLAALLKAIEAADKSTNGSKTHEYLIADLRTGSAQAVISEQRANKNVPQRSGIDTFGRCLQSVRTGRFEFARQHIECTKQIASIAREVEESFDGAEIHIADLDTVIINKAFQSKAIEAAKLPESNARWFKGTTFGSLDGRIIVESIRGGETSMILSLSVGGAEIQCVCPSFTSEDIEPFFGKRVRVSGKITYKGDTGLPSRIEVLQVPRIIKSEPDLMRWRGAFGGQQEIQGWDN